MITDQEIKEIRERADKATPGPWEWTDDGNGHGGWVRQSAKAHPREASDGLGTIATTMYYNGRNNGPFIAHARTDIPRLLDEVERLREALKGAAEILNHAGNEIKKLREENQRYREALMRIEYLDRYWVAKYGSSIQEIGEIAREALRS